MEQPKSRLWLTPESVVVVNNIVIVMALVTELCESLLMRMCTGFAGGAESRLALCGPHSIHPAAGCEDQAYKSLAFVIS